MSSEEEIRGGLAQLQRKELIRGARLSAVEDEVEYTFWHALIRDVAYAQISRTGRSRRHRAAAEWIQALAGDRVADRAELIAYHFTQALVHAPGGSGARSGSAGGVGPSCAGPGRRLDDRAGCGQGRGLLPAGPGALPAGHARACRVLAGAARAAFQAGRVAEAAGAYEEAIAGFAAESDVVGQGEALNRLSSVLWNQGEARRSRDALVGAVELLERARPGPELCSAYAQMAMDRVMSGHPQEALGWANKALDLAEELGGLPEERLRALDSRGVARGDLGDLGGMDDLRAALELGLEVGAGYDTAVVYNNLIEPLWLSEGPVAALETCHQAIEFTERRGLAEGTAWIRSATLIPLLDLGRWDEAVGTADALIAWERDHGGQYMSEMAHQIKAKVLLWRGEVDAARMLAREFLPRARAIDDLQLLVPALAVAAAVAEAAGEHTAARGLVEEVQRVVGDRGGGRWYLGQHVAELVRVCVALGERAAAEALAAQAQRRRRPQPTWAPHRTCRPCRGRGCPGPGGARLRRGGGPLGGLRPSARAGPGTARCRTVPAHPRPSRRSAPAAGRPRRVDGTERPAAAGRGRRGTRQHHRTAPQPAGDRERLVVPLPVAAAEHATEPVMQRAAGMLRRVGTIDRRRLWSPQPFGLLGRDTQHHIPVGDVGDLVGIGEAKTGCVLRTMPSNTSSSRTCSTCSTVPISSPPEARTGTPLRRA